MGERDHNQPGQNFLGLWRKRDLYNALGDGVGLAGSCRGDDGKIALDFFGKATARRNDRSVRSPENVLVFAYERRMRRFPALLERVRVDGERG